MSGDFGVFDDELIEIPIEMGAKPELHTIDDIETVLDTMRHLPEIELQQIRENLLKSIPATSLDNGDGIDWTSREMLILNSLTVLAFIAFGKHFNCPTRTANIDGWSVFFLSVDFIFQMSIDLFVLTWFNKIMSALKRYSNAQSIQFIKYLLLPAARYKSILNKTIHTSIRC